MDVYYRQWLNLEIPALVIENKVEASYVNNYNSKVLFKRMKGKPLVERPLRIGYFGLLRDEWSWQVLETLASSRPHDIEILVAGLPIKPINIPQRADKHANIEFRGEYRSPQDLSSLYNSVDMIWACYPYPCPGAVNWQWARTNRFYESCFFQKPMITLKGSGDGVIVENYSIGINVCGPGINAAVDILIKISTQDLARWQENISKLPRNVYMYTTEIDELKSALMAIATDKIRHGKKEK